MIAIVSVIAFKIYLVQQLDPVPSLNFATTNKV